MVFQIHYTQVPFPQRTLPVFVSSSRMRRVRLKHRFHGHGQFLAAAKDIFIAKQSCPRVSRIFREETVRENTHLEFRQAAKAAHIYPQAQSHGL